MGIASTTAIFSLVDGALLRPVPVSTQPGSAGRDPGADAAGHRSVGAVLHRVSGSASRRRSFEQVAAYMRNGVLLGGPTRGRSRRSWSRRSCSRRLRDARWPAAASIRMKTCRTARPGTIGEALARERSARRSRRSADRFPSTVERRPSSACGPQSFASPIARSSSGCRSSRSPTSRGCATARCTSRSSSHDCVRARRSPLPSAELTAGWPRSTHATRAPMLAIG